MSISSPGLDMNHSKLNILRYLVILYMYALFYVTHDIEHTSKDNILDTVMLLFL